MINDKKNLNDSIILVVSHDPSEIYNFCTRVIKIENQKIVFDKNIQEENLNVKDIQDLMECD